MRSKNLFGKLFVNSIIAISVNSFQLYNRISKKQKNKKTQRKKIKIKS